MQVDQILQLEPSEDDLRVELPLQALLDTQDSYEQWQNSSLTREYDVGKLIGLIDNLVSSLTVQRSSVKVLTILKQVFPFRDWRQKVKNSTLKQEVEARVSAWMPYSKDYARCSCESMHRVNSAICIGHRNKNFKGQENARALAVCAG